MMQDKDLDKIMKKWVDDETASAPKMRPTAEMYEQVESLDRRRSMGLLGTRRSVWAMTLGTVAVFALIFALVQWSPRLAPGGGQQVAQVPQRPAFAEGKGPGRGEAPPKGRGSRGEASPFKVLEFQVGGADASMSAVDLLAPQPSTVVLTAEDSYRLKSELAEARYVYVCQLTPTGALVLLYPNGAYSPKLNPTWAAETFYLPAEPNGLYIQDEAGVFRLYVIAAEELVPGLEALYAQNRRGGRFGRRTSPALLLAELDAIVGGQVEGRDGWVFEFEVR
jgi:hypothetical protein